MCSSDSNLKAWRLAETGQYQQALMLYDTLRANWTVGDWRSAGAFATVLMCVGKYDEAISAFQNANAMAVRDHQSQANLFLRDLGAAQWLAGDKLGGANTWREAVMGIQSGSIIYSDAAGGVMPGSLLWYAGVSLNDGAMKDEAKKYLQKLSNRKRITSWPGPLAQLILCRKTFDEIILDLSQKSNLDDVRVLASSNLLVRRRLCQVLFYWATSERHRGNNSNCIILMKKCSELTNPMLEVEWYLARGEAEVNM